MFIKPDRTEVHQLDKTIESLISEISGMTAGDEAHTHAVESLKTLMEIRNADKAASKRKTVNPDVIAAGAAHIIGIVMILGFEKANVITSKSLSFVPKVRL